MPEKFSIDKRGYNQQEVDTYIESLEAVIKSYKEKDSAIKNAIISAQLAADNIVQEAESQTKKIYIEAADKLKTINQSIAGQKRILSEFQEDYNALINRYIHQVNDKDISKLFSKIDELDVYLSKFLDTSDSNEVNE